MTPPQQTSGQPLLPPTPAQTVGPFYGYALPFPGGPEAVPPGRPDAITVHGVVYDGSGAPIPDALLEFWQADPDGTRSGAPGSLRRDPVTGGFLGRHPHVFTGFTRVATDADGGYAVHTLAPPSSAPYLAVAVFARGLLHHLYTRAYLPVDGAADDALLGRLAPERRATLLAVPGPDRTYRFDVRLQGENETVFLEHA
ncbi:protocatechuate 3,4-dioxygenase subunit alpha [Yinghuangia seranimata]|uniref:protocatechuate 3,4-dioxygenase subunit alpha n=1 Tax=Yinghuangia seranimata TaxID=408067 RepID=UPI00248AE924|nr:protocatechuate 3,4-dioxygenase subunit alpha [Yinghuangia seranimata]MDI2129678.1 protocatechuate 3,4-dioxygenase subunit alpha [Yinghuangia seranimata]